MAKKLKPTEDDLHFKDHQIILSETKASLVDFSTQLINALREDRKEIMTEIKSVLETQSKLDNSDIKAEIKSLKNWILTGGLLYILGALIQGFIFMYR